MGNVQGFLLFLLPLLLLLVRHFLISACIFLFPEVGMITGGCPSLSWRVEAEDVWVSNAACNGISSCVCVGRRCARWWKNYLLIWRLVAAAVAAYGLKFVCGSCRNLGGFLDYGVLTSKARLGMHLAKYSPLDGMLRQRCPQDWPCLGKAETKPMFFDMQRYHLQTRRHSVSP